VKVITPAASISPGGLLADHYRGASWDRWRAVLKAAWGEPLTATEHVLFYEVADRAPPTRPVKELWCVVGRGGGKDSIASAIAIVAALGDNEFLRPGEKATIFCLATDRDQAKIAHSYIADTLAESSDLAPLIVRHTADVIELSNRTEIVVATNSFRAVRGRSAVCAILDECAFSPNSEESALPVEETYRALTPALARVPGSQLIGISTPYRKTGLLYEKWAEFYGADDPNVLVVHGTSRQFNPLLSQGVVDAALKDDREAAGAEYLAEWRSDLSAYVDRNIVEGCVLEGVHELPPQQSRTRYYAFVDPAGGSGKDSMTLAIAHKDDDGVVIDCIREVKPHFSPEAAVAEFCGTLLTYDVREVVGDNFAMEWAKEPFRQRGVGYERCTKPKNQLYLEFLPLLNSGRVRWVDVPAIAAQLTGLERRVGRSGRDTIDHGRKGHDDVVNVVAGAALLAEEAAGTTRIPPEAFLRARQPPRRCWGRPQMIGLPYSISLTDLSGGLRG
jgi:hypothetical protein